jgi:mycothiol S-conjugate amidase
MPTPTEPLCLMTVHAHPDDEASKGASTVARYRDEGVRTVLVCCTGGEEGSVLNPAMDRPEVRERLHEIRLEELEASTKVIGYDEVVMLGYRDSGMPDTEANARPEAFANAPVDESVGRLVEIIRRVRPQVIVTYSDDQRGYPHPDHLMVHDISVLAFDRAGDAGWYPEHGEPFQPAKLYYSAWSMRRMKAMHDKMLELGIESPFNDKWFSRPSQDHRITTRVNVAGWGAVRRQALLAHATQVDPKSPFWFGLPDDIADELHTEEDYILARSHIDSPPPEDDLFAGLR